MTYKILEWICPRTGRGAFSLDYDKLGVKGEAACDERVRYLREQEPSMWRDPYAKKLSGSRDDDCRNLYEIRFKANNVQQRPMGYFGPRDNEFTVVVWVTHKGSQYSTTEFCRIAKERWGAVCSGAAKTSEVEID